MTRRASDSPVSQASRTRLMQDPKRLGRRVKTWALEYTCQRCAHVWHRVWDGSHPWMCPACHSRSWWREDERASTIACVQKTYSWLRSFGIQLRPPRLARERLARMERRVQKLGRQGVEGRRGYGGSGEEGTGE